MTSLVTEVDRDGLKRQLDGLERKLAWHAGGVDLVGVTADGVVELRFTGMCTGCPLRPMTMEATIRPALMRVDGVREVTATGARLPEEVVVQLRRAPEFDNRAHSLSRRPWLGSDVQGCDGTPTTELR